MVENQREYFKTGRPAELENRKEQLRRLRQVLSDNKDQLCDALYKDLKRQPKANYAYELSSVIVEIDYILDNLDVNKLQS